MLGFNTSGLSFYYCIEIALWKIHATDRDASPEAIKNAVIFSSKTHAFRLVGNDEIKADGKMYDIVAKKTVNGVTEYYATPDSEEDALIVKLTASGKAVTDKSIASERTKVFDAIYCLYKANKCPAPSILQAQTLNVCDSPAFYPDHLQAILSPPPDSFLS